jgi:hypothetical protein
LFYQRHPFAEVVDSLHLTVTQPDLGERPGGQDNEILLRFIVGVDVGDDDLIGLELGPCPVGNGRVDGLRNCVVHEGVRFMLAEAHNELTTSRSSVTVTELLARALVVKLSRGWESGQSVRMVCCLTKNKLCRS